MVLLMRGRRSVLACLGLVLLAGLAYAPVLHNPFVYDDLEAIQNNVFHSSNQSGAGSTSWRSEQ
jgi:hypothetical protein